MEEGSTDEKRRVIRAFVKEVRLDPDTHGGRAYVHALPDFATVSQMLCGGHEKSRRLSATASFQVVAGEGFEPPHENPQNIDGKDDTESPSARYNRRYTNKAGGDTGGDSP